MSKGVPTYKDLIEIVDVLKSLSRSRVKMEQEILSLQREVDTLKEGLRKKEGGGGGSANEDIKTLF